MQTQNVLTNSKGEQVYRYEIFKNGEIIGVQNGTAEDENHIKQNLKTEDGYSYRRITMYV